MSALVDHARADAAFAADALWTGLVQAHKRLPDGWPFDARGIALYLRLTRQPEHAAGEAEALLLERAAAPIAEAAGRRAQLVVMGAGLLRGLPALLASLDRPARCAALDLADVLSGAPLPPPRRCGRVVVVVPGCVLALFEPDAAAAWLERLGREAGPGALLIAGADASRDPAQLLPAYHDAAGVAAALNRNALLRLVREHEAGFALSAFRPALRFDAARQRVEMHLVSEYTQAVALRGRTLRFAMGESLRTAAFQQYGLLRMQALAHRAGWAPLQMWMDGAARHAVHVLERGA